MKKIALLICIISTCLSYAQQYPRVDIPGSEVRKITSSIVAGQEYELHILLPRGYSNSTKKYPVVYLMDSQWDFPLVKSIYGQQYYDGFIPDLIIVGITWGGVNPNPDSLRARDYTPTNEASLKQSGGADNFLRFMREELFPFIETNYKAGKANRTMMGCSFGGLITLYALFTQPEMFSGYIAASPAVGWHREVIYKYEKAFAERKLSGPIRLYMTVGDVENGRPGYERFAASFIDRKLPNISVQSKILENTGHSGTKSETYNRGLQFVFQRPKLTLGAAILNKYAGPYESSAGDKFELKNDNGQLTIYFSPMDKEPLYAASETEFYSTAGFFNIKIISSGSAIAGFELETYGGKQFFKKIN